MSDAILDAERRPVKDIVENLATQVNEVLQDAAEEVAHAAESIATALLPVRKVKVTASSAQRPDMDKIEFLVYAMPEEAVEAILRNVVKVLALEVGCESFEPHICIWRATLPRNTDPKVISRKIKVAIETWREALADECSKLKFDLDGCGMVHGSFVATMVKSPRLISLHDTIEQMVPETADSKQSGFSPHMTIIHADQVKEEVYKDMRSGDFTEAEDILVQQDGFAARKLFVASMSPEEFPFAKVIHEYDMK